MNKQRLLTSTGAFGLLLCGAVALATTNVDPVSKFSWGENIGFMNWADANTGIDGVEVFSDHLKGFIWGENVGWINTGDGAAPYANTNGTNFGVNILGSGFCDGFAWGENIGWINFGTQPSVGAQGASFDFVAGRFKGFAWGENVGWINLDDANVFVAASPVIFCFGDANSDGMIDFSDVLNVLGNFSAANCPAGQGTCGVEGVQGDANNDGLVNFSDVLSILGVPFGACP